MKIINEKEFKELVENSNSLIVADFFTTWCNPCKILAPILEDVCAMYDNVEFVKIDVDENRDLAVSVGVSSIPTLLFIKNKAVVDTSVGVISKENLIELIGRHI